MSRAKHARSKKLLTDVFLNVPYDSRFERLYLAYIAGISAFGLIPHASVFRDISCVASKSADRVMAT
jgi:hypothetical protein